MSLNMLLPDLELLRKSCLKSTDESLHNNLNKIFGELLRLVSDLPDSSPDQGETVDHPPHYNQHPTRIECIDIVEHMSFNLGNAIKYIWRARDKGKFRDDLRKAIWYLEREISRQDKFNCF
jgi:hypothetical protein